MKPSRIALIAAFIAVSVISVTADATILQFFSLETQVKQSTIIVQGNVVSSRTEVRNNIPYTLSEIYITETVKGTVAQHATVTVRHNTATVEIASGPILEPQSADAYLARVRKIATEQSAMEQ